MAGGEQRQRALDLIRQNIASSGHHLYVVAGTSSLPRFAYSIGISESHGAELILAGAIIYYKDDVVRILDSIADQLLSLDTWQHATFAVEPHGVFTLRAADPTWTSEFILGAFDYYGRKEKNDIIAYQIVPDEPHWTVDIPDLSKPWSPVAEPAWRWLREPWDLPIPATSNAATNLTALRGGRVTEAARWEEDYWEITAGPGSDVPFDEMRVVPLGTLLGADPSLQPVVNLAIGEGLWRDEDSGWQEWMTSTPA